MQRAAHDLSFPNLLNIRDLGAYRTGTGRQLRARSLLRSDDLHRLTPAGAEALLEYGVRTIIDLRWPADAQSHGNYFYDNPGIVQHHNISLLGESIDEWRALQPPAPKEMFNCCVLDCYGPQVRTVLRAIAAAPPGCVLFHCVSGKDRAGVIAALLLALVAVASQVIIDDYGLSTENLREPYLAAYPEARAATLERVRCPPEQIENMLAHLEERYGGIASYLRTIGLSDGELAQIKQRLL